MATPPTGSSETTTASLQSSTSTSTSKKPRSDKLVKLSQVMLVGNRYRKVFHLPLLPFYQDPDMKVTRVKQGKKTVTRITPRHARPEEKNK